MRFQASDLFPIWKSIVPVLIDAGRDYGRAVILTKAEVNLAFRGIDKTGFQPSPE